MSLLLITGAITLLLTIVIAWLMVLIGLKVKAINSLFPGYSFLVKAHVDYAIMTALIFTVYLVLSHLNLELPKLTIAAICIGSLLNPFFFLLMAIKPDFYELKPPASVIVRISTHTINALTSYGYIYALFVIIFSVI